MPYWNTIKNYIKTTLLVAVFPAPILAQTTGTSPYSRYALGDFSSNSAVFFQGMAGISTPFSFNSQINYLNPAGNSSFRTHTAIFDASLDGKMVEMESSEGMTRESSLGLSGLALGLPVAQNWGIVLGLRPYTNVGYDVFSEQQVDGAGRTRFIYEGSGGLNNLFLSTGYGLIQKGDSLRLSVGAQASFLFGAINYQRSVEFSNTNYSNLRVKNSLFVNDVIYRAGTQFEAAYRKNTVQVDDKGNSKTVRKEFFRYGFGASYDLGGNVRARRDEFAYTYTKFGFRDIINDTIAALFDEKGTIQMPWKLTLGGFVSFNKDFTLSAQYDLENWEGYQENFSTSGIKANDLTSLSAIRLGFMYRSFKKLDAAQRGNKVSSLSATTYMIGVNRTNLPLNFNGTPLISDAVSFGLSIPLTPSRTFSSINFGMELGRRGRVSDSPISERFATVRLGIVITPDIKYERWFFKYKYD
ncbi:MAG: hypothetical protein ACK4K0_06225 [Flavobacteriales bacterium]